MRVANYKRKRRFQSTPPQGGRPDDFRDEVSEAGVSIHAPAGGATTAKVIVAESSRFNPRPRRGGDVVGAAAIKPIKKFQSTPPQGGRLWRFCSLLPRTPSFNPRPRRGGDCPRLVVSRL